jgi:hypothetical protein
MARKQAWKLTYEGGAFDNLDDGKTEEIKTYDLWGTKLPKGKAVRVVRADLVAKARALGLFKVEDVAD